MGPQLAPLRAALTSQEQRWFDYAVATEIEH